MGWFSSSPKDDDAEEMTRIVCSIFETGEVFMADLGPNKINEIVVRKGKDQAKASWYSRGSSHSVSLNGESIPVRNSLGDRIVRAAQRRADGVARDRLAAELKRRRQSNDPLKEDGE